MSTGVRLARTPWSKMMENPHWGCFHTLQAPLETIEQILRLAGYLFFQEFSVWEVVGFSILWHQLLPLSSKPQALSGLMNQGNYGPWAALAEAQRRWNMCSGWGSSISFIVPRSMSHTIALNLFFWEGWKLNLFWFSFAIVFAKADPVSFLKTKQWGLWSLKVYIGGLICLSWS